MFGSEDFDIFFGPGDPGLDDSGDDDDDKPNTVVVTGPRDPGGAVISTPIIIISPPLHISFPTSIPPKLITLTVPAYLQGRGFTRIPPLSPAVLQKLQSTHGSGAFSWQKTRFFPFFSSTLTLQLIQGSVISPGHINPAASTNGTTAIEYDFGFPVGDNRFGDLFSNVRLILLPVNGVGATPSIYSQTDGRR